jgi:hypothetical protein
LYCLFIIVGFTACPPDDNGKEQPKPTYNSITINPNIAYIIQGGTQTFYATVNGSNNPNQSIAWSVEGGKTGTTIIDGVLTIANNEMDNTIITIRAVSNVAPSVFTTTTVTIHKGFEYFGTWFCETGPRTCTINESIFRVDYPSGYDEVGQNIWSPYEISSDFLSDYHTGNGFLVEGKILDSSIPSKIGLSVTDEIKLFLHNDKEKLIFYGLGFLLTKQ